MSSSTLPSWPQRRSNITYLILILTFPLAYPISLCLDSCIKHHGPVRNRKYLAAYIDMINSETHLEPFEIATLRGTLSLNSMNVRQIMTPMDKVVSLPETAVLNWETFVTFLKTGYSRIPIYRDNDKSYIVGLLHIKEIATVFGFNSNIQVPVKFIMEKAPRPLNFVSAESPLSRNNFINSLKTGIHLAFVVEGPVAVSTKKQVIGIVTLEDMIEAVTGQQISDETDMMPASDKNKKERKKGMLYAQQILKALQEEGRFPQRKFLSSSVICGHTQTEAIIIKRRNVCKRRHNLSNRRIASYFFVASQKVEDSISWALTECHRDLLILISLGLYGTLSLFSIKPLSAPIATVYQLPRSHACD